MVSVRATFDDWISLLATSTFNSLGDQATLGTRVSSQLLILFCGIKYYTAFTGNYKHRNIYFLYFNQLFSNVMAHIN